VPYAAVAITPGPSIASVWIIAVAAVAASIRITAAMAITPITVAPLDIFTFNIAALINNASSVATAVATARGTPVVVIGWVATAVGARIGTVVRIAIVTGMRGCDERTEQREEARNDQCQS
jgi:hypothetical protein